MDKYEYKLKLEQIRKLMEGKDYKTAAQIAGDINWKKVKSVATLCMIGEIYEKAGNLEESREILLMAYDRSPVGRNIIYRLTLVAIKLKSLEEAQEYYEEFLEVAPHDNMKYVLKYELSRAKGVSLEDLISILEEFKEREYTEEWAFELACLYHEAGNGEKCVDICDELILWFGEGKYVERALELKMLYQPLNKLQEDKYRRFKQQKEGVVEVSPNDTLVSGEIVSDTVKIPTILPDAGRFNTQNLQAELARSMQQIIDATEQGTVQDTIQNIKKMVGEVPIYHTQQLEEEKPEGMESWPATEEGTEEMEAWPAAEEGPEGMEPWPAAEEGTEEMEPWPAAEGDAEGLEAWPMEDAEDTGSRPMEEDQESPVAGVPLEEGGLSDQEQGLSGQQEAEDEIPDGALNIDFKGILSEEYDGQISLRVPDAPRRDLQITGQMSIEDILSEWEKTKEAARIAIAEAEQRKLEAAKSRALAEAESLMERLTQTQVMEAEVEAVYVAPVSEIPELQEAIAVVTEDSQLVEGFPTKEIPVRAIAAALSTAEEETSAAEKEASTAEEGASAPEKEASTAAKEASTVGKETSTAAKVDSTVAKETSAAKVDSTAAKKTSTEEEESLAKRIIRQQKQQQKELEQELRKERLMESEVTLEKTEEDVPLTGLTEDQKKIFTYFTLISGMERQLCQALEGARQRKKNRSTSHAGNLAIMGGKGSGKTALATNFAKAYQKYAQRTGGKVGKISASVLNQKDASQLFATLEGGCLIIERAGDLSRESVKSLSALMEGETKGLLVVLEDNREGIEKAMGRDSGFAKKFTEQIRVPVFTNDELVAFAKAYAREQNCEIDDMGVLALYNSISNIQKVDEATTLTEVKDIMDEAIYRANRGGLKKLFGGKRNTENGLVLIKEKDFDI